MQVAVIGAGAAGLVTARELLREGLSPVVFEQAERPGGTWIYDPRTEGVHGALYASLRTNLPRDLMAFDDLAFDDLSGGDPRRFPGHAEVLRYLDRFTEVFSLRPRLRPGRRVTSLVPEGRDGPWHAADPLPPTGWRVGWRDPEGEHQQSFHAVAVCNGHYHVPRIPSLPGQESFRGRVLHSHGYREPTPFTGQTVALLGAKSSGTDLSLELSTVARRVILCGRELPRADGLGPTGRLCHRPAIERLEPHALCLADGSREEGVDALILCTGYRYVFDFLDPAAGLLDPDDRRPFPLWLDLVCAHADTLAFVGLPFQVVPFPLMLRQARLWARMMAGVVERPDRAARLRMVHERDALLAAQGVPVRHRLRYGPEQWPYLAHLARLAGDPAPPAWREHLNRIVAEARREDRAGYRDRAFPTAEDLEQGVR